MIRGVYLGRHFPIFMRDDPFEKLVPAPESIGL